MRLVLVNADTAEDIRTLEEGGSLSILVHPFVTLRVEDVRGGPLTFRDNDRPIHVADEAPFTVTAEEGDGYRPYPLTIGEHTFEVEGGAEVHTLGLTVTVDAEEPEPEPEEPEPTPEPEPEPTPEEPEEPAEPEPTPEEPVEPEPTEPEEPPAPEPAPEPEPEPTPEPTPEPEPAPEPEEPADDEEDDGVKGKHRRKPGQRIIDSGLYAAYDADGEPVPGEGQPLAATFRKGTKAPPISGVSGGFWQLEHDTNPHDRASKARGKK